MRISVLRFCVGLLLASALLAPLPAAAQNTILTPLPIITELGSLDEGASTVYALNDRGQAVGASSSVNGERAVLWQDGRTIELPTLGGDSMALDINNHGQIVGWSRVDGGEAHAVLWENGAIRDLGLFKAGEDAYAHKINEAAGTGIGEGRLHSSASGWTYANALAGADPAEWHHYALVWDEDGIVGLGNGTIKVAALVNDKLITKRMQYNPPFEMAAPLDGQLALLNASSSLWQGSAQFSNLNVWSYARVAASELPRPQLYLPKVTKSQ